MYASIGQGSEIGNIGGFSDSWYGLPRRVMISVPGLSVSIMVMRTMLTSTLHSGSVLFALFNSLAPFTFETKRINEAVKNNVDKLHTDFYFQLSNDESEDLRTKASTTIFAKTMTNPKVFTE